MGHRGPGSSASLATSLGGRLYHPVAAAVKTISFPPISFSSHPLFPRSCSASTLSPPPTDTGHFESSQGCSDRFLPLAVQCRLAHRGACSVPCRGTEGRHPCASPWSCCSPGSCAPALLPAQQCLAKRGTLKLTENASFRNISRGVPPAATQIPSALVFVQM